MRIPSAAAILAMSVLAWPTVAGAQSPHSLSLSGPPSVAVERATVLQASGVVPSDVFLERYLNVYALPGSVVTSCPSTYQSALQIKDNTTSQGGETVALGVPVEGAFSTPVAWTPRVRGRFLMCGYVHDMVENWATAGHSIEVIGGGDAAKPKMLKRPGLRRSGRKLTCSAGRWSERPTRFTYHWRVDGRTRAGAKTRTLRVSRAVKGRAVQCGVTATNAAGSATGWSRRIRVL